MVAGKDRTRLLKDKWISMWKLKLKTEMTALVKKYKDRNMKKHRWKHVKSRRLQGRIQADGQKTTPIKWGSGKQAVRDSLVADNSLLALLASLWEGVPFFNLSFYWLGIYPEAVTRQILPDGVWCKQWSSNLDTCNPWANWTGWVGRGLYGTWLGCLMSTGFFLRMPLWPRFWAGSQKAHQSSFHSPPTL